MICCNFADKRGGDCVARVAAANAALGATLFLGQPGAGLCFECLLLWLRDYANPLRSDGEEMGRPAVFRLWNAPQLRGRPLRPAGGQTRWQELAHYCSLCARTGRGMTKKSLPTKV